MEILELVNFRQNYEKNIKQKLLEFDVFFQNHMWDGFSEDKGQFVSDEDFEAIQALSEKMEHMILNIGCPSSIPEMLTSISERKIKYWASRNHNDHGKQLRRKSERAKVTSEWYYESDRNHMVIKGHFRWNWRGYMISRTTADLLRLYLTNMGFFD